MKSLNPYLTFSDNCEAAFNFYKSVFGGEFTFLGRFSEMPPQEGVELSEEELNRIMHVSLQVGQTTLMGSDTGGNWAPNMVVGNNFSLSIGAESKEEADDLFGKLSEGGKVTMPMAPTFWGDYFGMCTDKFDINWMISFNENQQ
ncbi:MAG: VOC family protein [Aurantibacter sp.]